MGGVLASALAGRSDKAVVRRSKAHAVEDILVAGGREDFIGRGEIVLGRRLVAPDMQQVGEPGRYAGGLTVIAPIGLLALAEDVVEFEEFDDAVPAVAEQLVEAPSVDVHGIARRREIVDQGVDRQLGQDDGRRLQRLEKAGGQADGQAITLPETFAMARAEGQTPRRQGVERGPWRRAPEIGFKRRRSVVVTGVGGRIDAADTPPGRQADIPDPAGGMGRSAGMGGDGAVGCDGHLNRQGAIVEQLRGAVDEGNSEMAAGQHGGVAGAVEEQVACDRAIAAGVNSGNGAIVRRRHRGDMVADMAHAQAFRAVAHQQPGQLHGVEVVGIVDRAAIVRHGALARRQVQSAQGGLRADGLGKGFDRGVIPGSDEIARFGGGRRHEGVEILVVRRTRVPGGKGRSLLERGIAGCEEVGLGDADPLQGAAHGGPCALADADRRDVGRFD